MCGITGLVGKFDPSLIGTMTDLLAHRGPDDRGTWTDSTNGVPVMLGSRRLAILDLSDAGHMPMESSDGRYVIVFNGEIYNHVELRAELEDKGETFRSDGDTEVLLAAYRLFGSACLSKLNGMFAIAIWDKQSKELFLARDRLGVKPLYYSQQDSRFYFSSEIKSFYADPDFHSGINKAAISDFLSLQYVPWPNTAFEAVNKIPPGHFAIYANGNLRLEQFWSAADALTKKAPTPDQLAELLDDAVRLRLRSDVPVGLFLSGGIDSSIVASLTSRRAPHILAFTVGFDSGGERFDETSLARETAEKLDLKHRVVDCTADEFVEYLPTLIWHLDEPVGENLALPFFRLSMHARSEFTVALSGEGADEVFYGYRYYTLEYIRRIAAKFGLNALGKPLWKRIAQSDFADDTKRRALMYISRPDAPSAFWSWSTAVFTRDQLRDLIPSDSEANSGAYEQMIASARVDRVASSLDVSPLLDLNFRMIDYLLTVRDKMTMAASLELRCPFLDYRVVEAGLATPADDKLSFRKTKLSLRKAVAGIVPPAVQDRRKRPFSSPVSYWLEKLVDRYLRDSECVRDGILCRGEMDQWLIFDVDSRSLHPHKTFNLLVLEIWYRIFITRSLSPKVIPGTVDNSSKSIWNDLPRTKLFVSN